MPITAWIMKEMTASRGYKVSPEWREPHLPRQDLGPAYPESEEEDLSNSIYILKHQNTYLKECLENLAEKGTQLD